MGNKLTAKQQAFVDEYIVDLNGTQAAIRAGYSPNTAESQAVRLLRNAKVAAALSEAVEKRSERTKVNADYVLNRLVSIDQMDIADIHNEDGTIKPIKDWPKIWRQFVNGIDVSEIFGGSGDERTLEGLLKKIKWPDKLRNLELIGKHVDVQAWKDRIEAEQNITVSGLPQEIADMIYGGRGE